ncbi:hypothetical protein GCM10009654_38490 [Streptomyces hebeiensis]|uniref:Uncharacterized protein n=1 Tax=Streptomyces hebeiensis TaxID=229486 RepID=A0ABN1UX16_9ACTN
MTGIHPQPRSVVQAGPDNTDIEDGDGGGSNPSSGCGDNSGLTAA